MIERHRRRSRHSRNFLAVPSLAVEMHRNLDRFIQPRQTAGERQRRDHLREERHRGEQAIATAFSPASSGGEKSESIAGPNAEAFFVARWFARCDGSQSSVDPTAILRRNIPRNVQCPYHSCCVYEPLCLREYSSFEPAHQTRWLQWCNILFSSIASPGQPMLDNLLGTVDQHEQNRRTARTENL